MDNVMHCLGPYFCPVSKTEPGETNFELIPNSHKSKVRQNKFNFHCRMKCIIFFSCLLLDSSKGRICSYWCATGEKQHPRGKTSCARKEDEQGEKRAPTVAFVRQTSYRHHPIQLPRQLRSHRAGEAGVRVSSLLSVITEYVHVLCTLPLPVLRAAWKHFSAPAWL